VEVLWRRGCRQVLRVSGPSRGRLGIGAVAGRRHLIAMIAGQAAPYKVRQSPSTQEFGILTPWLTGSGS
jgi:hypothetical protein